MTTLAELGARIVILDREQQACEERAAETSARWSVDAMGLGVDLVCEAEVRTVPEQVLRRFERLDILMHCAALAGTAALRGCCVPFEAQSADTLRQALEVNLTACFVLTQCCAPALRAAGCGSVINIGSIYGMVGPDLRIYGDTGMGNPAAYAARKGGLLQLTRWLATVLAPDIRVNMISCGGIERRQPPAFQREYIARVPLRRMGVEADFVGALGFLAGDLSRYVTGQNLVVDGGWTAW